MKANESSLINGTYKKISEDLKNNNYSIGTKLQPIRSLAKKFNVSYLTAQKAIKALQLQGTLEARPGDGLYVVGKPVSLTDNVLEFISKNDSSKNTVERKRRDTYCIGVVMPFWLSTYGSTAIYEIVNGLVSEGDKLNWPIELIHNSGNESELPEFLEKIKRRNFSGIVWLQPFLSHKMNLMRLADFGYDVVITGRNFKDLPIKSILFDHQDMAKKIADHFAEINAKKIVMFTGPIEGFITDPYSVEIVNALKSEFEKRGGTLPNEHICQAFLSNKHDLIIEDFIKNNSDMEGMICLHEYLKPDIEKAERKGYLKTNRKISMIDISYTFFREVHNMEKVEIIGMRCPLENMGRLAIKHFEEKWVENKVSEPIDLSIELLK
ncbi:MAG: hypothetical protein A2Y10_03670 [Planctomycetes bacterium GWF2_41_51]|nr:MAG: hypothetical protein A2Y10_03670 [Planctomycetes bacterium GWF2_41_51]HBG28842.1 hypothetical protein [Phycisphaerales bacterium]